MPAPFERQLNRINVTRAQIDRLNRTLALVPYRKPVIGEVEFTSGFGVRSDPFLGRPAMHTGLDFRAATGDPVRVTANGKVVSAGWAGGYGRMVEVDHGNGLSTRYGHLSEINVKVGEISQDRPGDRRRRLDRPLDRPASALRNPHRRRSGRSAEIPARRRAAERGLKLAATCSAVRLVPDLAGDDVAEQLPALAVELHQLHLLDREKVSRRRC